MQNKIKQLYELLYSSIITPFNLLENAKLENYEYVNYSRTDDGLLVTMKCAIEIDFIATFRYYFDRDDMLQHAIMDSDEGQEIIFSRKDEIAKVRDTIHKQLDMPFTNMAI